ncbi:MAG TPA: GNAT family N-acetyltransferase [Spirochaetia bacterium]
MITIRACDESDLDDLVRIGRETYDETFRPMNTAETMDAYLAEAFDPRKILSELRSPGTEFYFLLDDGSPAGYLKLNSAPSQSDLNDPSSLEIERIYVRRGRTGQGLGRVLMDFALARAVELGRSWAWLGVWEKNTAALGFYRRMGFQEAGTHTFRMGEEIQRDFIMRREL